VLDDPIFASTVSLDHIATFMAAAGWKICLRVVLVLALLAALAWPSEDWA
jgi:hypothetical protein